MKQLDSTQCHRKVVPYSALSQTFSLTIIIACLGLFPASASSISPQELFRSVEGKVFILEVLDSHGNKISAHTALLVDGKKIVTQCDLLEGAESLRVRQEDKTYPASTLFKDNARNLCILEATNSSGGLKLRETDPAPGSRVYAVSNALALGISISEGVVSGIREANGESAIQFTAPIAPGSEGGGLFDEDGRLVGIINYRQRDGQNVNFAQPARWIREIEARSTATDASATWRNKLTDLSKSGKWQEMSELAKKWIEVLPDNLEARYALAYIQNQLKDWPAAEKSYRELFKRDPTSPTAGLGLTGALFQGGKFQETLEAAQATLAYHRENVLIWLYIAFAKDALGDFSAAKNALEKAAQLEPWNRQTLQSMVSLGRRHKEWSLAIAAQSRLVEFDTGDVAARMDLADLYLVTGRSNKALIHIDKALELAPDNGDAWVMRGYALSGVGRYREAEETLKKGLGLNPKNRAAGWKLLGEIYSGLRQYPEAIAAYREGVRVSQKDVVMRAELGIALKDGFQFQEALPLFEKIREEQPDDPLPWRQLGYIYAYMNQADKAIPAYEKSLSLDANQPKVWAALIESYHFAGRMDDAKRSYQKLKAIDQKWADSVFKRMLLPYEVAP